MFSCRLMRTSICCRGKSKKLEILASSCAWETFDLSVSTIATHRDFNRNPTSPWMLQIPPNPPQTSTRYFKGNNSNWIISKRLYQSTFEHNEKYEDVNKSETEVVDYNYIKMMTKGSLGVIIDVRNAEELRGPQGRIPGSVNIPLSEVPQAFGMRLDSLVKKYQIPNLKNKDDEIVFHCKGGVRSEQACKIAKSLGFRNVKNYKGSMDDYFQRETGKRDEDDDHLVMRPQPGWLTKSFKE